MIFLKVEKRFHSVLLLCPETCRAELFLFVNPDKLLYCCMFELYFLFSFFCTPRKALFPYRYRIAVAVLAFVCRLHIPRFKKRCVRKPCYSHVPLSWPRAAMRRPPRPRVRMQSRRNSFHRGKGGGGSACKMRDLPARRQAGKSRKRICALIGGVSLDESWSHFARVFCWWSEGRMADNNAATRKGVRQKSDRGK